MSFGYYGPEDRKLLQEIEAELDIIAGHSTTALVYQKDLLAAQRSTNDKLDKIIDALTAQTTDLMPSIAELMGQSLELQVKILAALAGNPVVKPAVALKFGLGTPGIK